jgi:polar amino acid transport system permease protein
MDLRWEILAGYGPLFVSGLWTTIELTLIAIGAGMLLGVVLGLVSSSADAPRPKTLVADWLM